MIIAEFNNTLKKNEFVKAAKKKRITSTMLGQEGEIKPIYVDEQLTRESYQLFSAAKGLKKIGMKHVWISQGDVLVREKDDSMVVKIQSQNQISEIEKKLVLNTKGKSSNTNNNGTKKPDKKADRAMKKKPKAIDNSNSDDSFESIYTDTE